MKRVRHAWLIHLLLIISCSIIISPVLFAAIKATQTRAQTMTPRITPGNQLLTNIQKTWTTAKLGTYMRNSLLIAVIVTAGKTIFSLLAALAIVYFSFRGKQIVFAAILVTLLLPTEVLVVPLFELIALQPPPSWLAFWEWIRNPRQVFLQPVEYGFGWSNTFMALTVPFLASATAVFLFRQHFMSVPREYADAAKIDGAGPIRFLWSILVPMSVNTIGALAVIQFVYVWDQYLWPRVIIRRDEYQVIQVGLNRILGGGEQVPWELVMTGAILAIIPPLIIFMLLQEQFMRGFALSQEK